MPLENIYPNEFFSINNPDAPVVNIQFRTNADVGDITEPQHWESITFDPSNYFNDLRIEDQGGAQQLTMNLQDTNFARLENIIIRAQLATRFANKLTADGPKTGDAATYLQFFISHANSANLRIRIGYSEYGDDTNYIDASEKLEPEWQDRINSRKPVIRSPWLYFQISGAQFRYTESAMKVEIKAFSVGGSFLDQAKMIKKFAKLVGEPERILREIEEIVKEAAANSAIGDSQEEVEFLFEGDPPVGYPDESGGQSIEIMLGSEADVPRRTETEGGGIYRSVPSYKSLKQVLTEICDKVKPKIYGRDGTEIIQDEDASVDGSGVADDNQLIDKVVKYGYSISEVGNKTTVIFYYRDPNKQAESQQLVRTYIWNEYGQSIIKELDAETKTDFAALNLQLITVDENSGEAVLNVATPNPSNDEQQDSEVDYTIGNLTDASAALSSPDFNAMFVREIKTPEAYQGSSFRNAQVAGNMLARMVVENLNNTVFTGRLTLPGDPFFIFDASVTPFTYLIKVIAQRPSYIDENGIRTEGGVSYVSGLYIIKKIDHTISGSGFTTTLEIMKWPRKGETL